jgi:DNA-binding transcriptional MocR family regulator
MIAAIQRHVPPNTLRFGRPGGGLYLWCRLALGASADALLDRALVAGVAFVAGSAFYADPAGDSELRLCFTSVLPQAMDESIRKLAGCLSAARLTATA